MYSIEDAKQQLSDATTMPATQTTQITQGTGSTPQNSTPGGDNEIDEQLLGDLPEPEIVTKTRVKLKELPLTVVDIQNAIFELATQINLEDQNQMKMNAQ